MRQRRRGLLVGIIPAYAGNTRCRALLSARAWDHPRICGEHLKLGQRAKIGWGSSPHMRGTRSRSRTRRNEGGIIPAYAGNTLFESISADPSRDHPRICGEHRPAGLIRDGQQGSSPHMRGTRCDGRKTLVFAGIIPAYAGNTSLMIISHPRFEDHPRICGEHVWPSVRRSGHPGSSPHMRGTHQGWRDDGEVDGIIPAYAGNTECFLAMLFHVGDHPRICGEHQTMQLADMNKQGSSPHMRGTRTVGYGESCRIRIIPAYAGNTAIVSKKGKFFRDHPRICGEHPCSGQSVGSGWGSSPHMRGTL